MRTVEKTRLYDVLNENTGATWKGQAGREGGVEEDKFTGELL